MGGSSGGGIGGIVKSVASPVTSLTGGMNMIPGMGGGGLNDLLYGKEVKDKMRVFDPEVQKVKKKSANMYGQSLDDLKDMQSGAGDFVRGQVTREQQAIGVAGEDAKRRLDQQVAARGLGNSSIGLGQTIGIDRDIAEKKAGIGATLGQRQRDARQNALSNILSASGTGMGFNVDRQFEKGGRKGGIAELAGAGIGAFFGGPAGAKAGMGIGSAMRANA